MSISYVLYSPNPQVPGREQITAQLRSRGWFAVAVDPGKITDLLPDGTIEYDLLLGSRTQEGAEQVGGLVHRKDPAGLDELCAQRKLATCTIAATHPYDFNQYRSEEEASELVSEIGPERVMRMKQAMVEYEVETSATRSAPSHQFQVDVWEILGELAGGLMEDPQAGSFQWCESGTRTPI